MQVGLVPFHSNMGGQKYQQEVRDVAKRLQQLIPHLSGTLSHEERKPLLALAKKVRGVLDASQRATILTAVPELTPEVALQLWNAWIASGAVLEEDWLRGILFPTLPAAVLPEPAGGSADNPHAADDIAPTPPAAAPHTPETTPRSRKKFNRNKRARAAELWGRADEERKQRIRTEAARLQKLPTHCLRTLQSLRKTVEFRQFKRQPLPGIIIVMQH